MLSNILMGSLLILPSLFWAIIMWLGYKEASKRELWLDRHSKTCQSVENLYRRAMRGWEAAERRGDKELAKEFEREMRSAEESLDQLDRNLELFKATVL